MENQEVINRPLKELLTTDVVTVPPQAPLPEAVKLMADRRISCVIVADQDRIPVGILTERDLVRLTRKLGTATGATVNEVMTSPVKTVSGDTDIFESYHILASNRIRHLVVVDSSGRTEGIVTQSDILKNLGLDLGEVRKISTIMTRDLCKVASDSTLDKLLDLMSKRSISCVVVEDGGVAKGIISERDIARMINEKLDFATETTGAQMSKPLITIDGDMPIHEAARLMNMRNLRRLVIVDENGSATGVITQTDIVKGVLEGRYLETLQEILKRKDEILARTEQALVEKTIFLDSILHSAKDLIVMATDTNMRIVYYNAVAEDVFGFSSAEVTGKTVQQMHEREGGNPYNFRNAMKEVDETGEYSSMMELNSAAGKRIIGFRVSCVRDFREIGNEVKGYMYIGRDITRKHRETDLIKESEARYRSIFENSKDMVYITSMEGEILEVNQAGSDMFHIPREKMTGYNIKNLYKNSQEREKFMEIVLSENYVKDYELDMVRPDGTLVHTLITAAVYKSSSGKLIGFQGIIRDITERKKQEEVINFLAFHDALTNLPNRRTFHDRLVTELSHVKRGDTGGAVLFLDLDGFKEVNDRLGHDVGDRLLQQAAGILKRLLREEDTVSRLGGDEFTILLSRIDEKDDAEIVARKVVEALAEPMEIDGNRIQISTSVGVSLFPDHGLEAEQVIKRADDAMYRAKEEGKNRYKFFGRD